MMEWDKECQEDLPWWRDGYSLLTVASFVMWAVILMKALIRYLSG